jgi:digeranylgeranylglycerophospholipid reductase
MTVIECDVLVVGAGPGGSVAALYCSKLGLTTVLIERNNNVGLHAATRIDSSPDFGLSKIITELELKTENMVYNSTWQPPSERSFTLHSKVGEYYFKRGPDHDSFECSTVSSAVKNGCTLFLDARVNEINRIDDKSFEAVTIVQGAEKIVIKPKIIIAADGGKSIFHKYVDKQFVKENRVAYGVTGKDFVSPETSEIYFDAELAPGGYFYIVTGLEGLSSAGIVLDKNKVDRSPKRYFSDFLSKHPTIADTIKSRANEFVGEGRLFKLKQHTRGNLLLVGEAAGLIDPLMGYGMMPAIVSGYYAGKYSAEAIKSGDYEALNNYEREVRKRFNRRMSYVFSRIFESLDNKDLDIFIKMANDLDGRTDVDDLIDHLSLTGLFHTLRVFVKNLPRSGRLLAKSCKGLCETIYSS